MFRKGCQKDGVAPIKDLAGIRPDASDLRKIGCTAFLNILSQFPAGIFDRQARKIVRWLSGGGVPYLHPGFRSDPDR